MNAPHLRCFVSVLACALIGCSTTATSAAAAGPTTAIKGGDAPDPSFDARADAEGRVTAPTCVVRQAPRTFVGFADTQSLDDFEVTALEAERVLKLSKVALCQLSAAQDKDGTLRAALSGGVVEITAVRFQRADLSRAVLSVQTMPADGGKPSTLETRWLVHEERVAGAWQVASAVRQKAKRH